MSMIEDSLVDADSVEKLEDMECKLDWLWSEAIDARDDAEDTREIVCWGYGAPGRSLQPCVEMVGFLRLMGSETGVAYSSQVGSTAGSV